MPAAPLVVEARAVGAVSGRSAATERTEKAADRLAGARWEAATAGAARLVGERAGPERAVAAAVGGNQRQPG